MIEASNPATEVSTRARFLVLGAALIALFLGALDALVVGSAMPTIISDLGGLELYSWVFSSYLLARAVSLPIFGKLSDLFSRKRLYLATIIIFLLGSLFAGIAEGMGQLILARTLQGIGAGGTFALAYIVVADLTSPERRGKMMGLISFVWGVASILGPALGGLIVTYFSWRWIFFLNVPLSLTALLGIMVYLHEVRRRSKPPKVDFLGAVTLSITVLSLLVAFLLAGRTYRWFSPEILLLFATTVSGGAVFYLAERRAAEPILALHFFANQRFRLANGAAFLSSFAIFSLSAYSPLFVQGVLGRSPAELGLAMVPLSLGWSVGALACGQTVTLKNERRLSLWGCLWLTAGAGLSLTFSPSTPLIFFSATMALAGFGMGFVSVTTLLIVQNSLDAGDLGIATSSQQFARTLGGTIGIGISGGLATGYFTDDLAQQELHHQGLGLPRLNVESVFQPELQKGLSETLQKSLQAAVESGVKVVFWSSLIASLLSLLCCYLLPRPHSVPTSSDANGEDSDGGEAFRTE